MMELYLTVSFTILLTVSNNNMADARTYEAEVKLAPLNL